VATYSSFVAGWTWSGLIIESGHAALTGYHSPLGRIGSGLTVIAVVAAIIVFRDRPPAVSGMVTLCAALMVTAGFGVQYLMWPLPLMFAVGGRRRIDYTVAAGFLAALFYLVTWHGQGVLVGASWLVVTMLGYVVAEAWAAGRRVDRAADEGEGDRLLPSMARGE